MTLFMVKNVEKYIECLFTAGLNYGCYMDLYDVDKMDS